MDPLGLSFGESESICSYPVPLSGEENFESQLRKGNPDHPWLKQILVKEKKLLRKKCLSVQVVTLPDIPKRCSTRAVFNST